MSAPAPGWYPDPGSGWHYRYWDGSTWTEHTAPVSGGAGGGGGGGQGVRPLPFAGVRADFGRRVIGYLIDAAVLLVPIVVIFGGAIALFIASLPSDDTQSPNSGSFAVLFLAYPIVFVIGWGYQLYFQTGGRRTVGQRVAKLRVVDATTGAPLTLGKAFLRVLIAGIASGQVVGLGYWWALWDAEGRTWHDMVAGSVVLDER